MSDAYIREKSAVRIGSGAGFSGDRIEPAVVLAEYGRLDYLGFECLAERTIARAVRSRMADPDGGYDPLLIERMTAVLPTCARQNTRIISNMGAANPVGAARATAATARGLGLSGLKIAAVIGDDVLQIATTHGALDGLAERAISANAYMGAEPVVEALAAGADIVLTGRIADSSLFLAPAAFEFGWAFDDWEKLGRGAIMGHLLECAGQVTGGYFADPGYKTVEGLARLGFPLAEVSPDGSLIVTKVPGTGGAVTVAGVKEQLLYELHDPGNYLSPDVTADFSSVIVHQAGPDRVSVERGGGRKRPDQLKVSVGYQDGFVGEGQISYGGPGAQMRGRLALDIMRERLDMMGDEILETRFDLIGVDSLLPGSTRRDDAGEVRARIAARTRTLTGARQVGREVDALYTNGPAGGGGVFQTAYPVIAMTSTLLDRSLVRPDIIWETT